MANMQKKKISKPKEKENKIKGKQMKENNFPNNKIRLAVSYGIRESVWKESKAKNMTLNHLMTLI